MMKRHLCGLLLLLCGAMLASGARAQIEDAPYMDPSLPVDERVEDLVSRMTLEEKVSQMSHLAPAIERLGVIAYDPIFDNPFDFYQEFDPEEAERVKQERAWENYEHWEQGDCLDGGWWSEALHGVARSGLATAFPQAIGLGSTWNPELIQRMTTAVSDEAWVHHLMYGKKLTFWSPTINMLRDPRWGRNEEAYSEDPYLMGRIAVAFVKGMQGDHPKYLKTVSTLKHFVANNSEFNRHYGSSDVSERMLREYYLPAFKAGITEAGAYSVMSAYNALNGTSCTGNKRLLTEILRDEWSFKGYVVSDCGAVSDILHEHKHTDDPQKAVAMAVNAGCDLECETCEDEQFMYDKYLLDAVKNGYVSEDTITKSVKRLFRARFLLGEFDPPEMVPYTDTPFSKLDSLEHRRLALEVARESIILLKNENNALPLDADEVESVALIGPNADVAELGGYSGSPAIQVSPLDGVRGKLGAHRVYYEKGCGIKETMEGGLERAAELAGQCDAAIVVVGTNLTVANEHSDRRDLNLPGIQEDLVRAVYEANPNTVVVLMNGMPLTINWTAENVPAILEVWYPGQSGGTALADVIFGDYNPGGKLPVTFYKSVDQLPPLDDYDITKGRTYWYFEGETLYAFGHGLSYTDFRYDKLETSRSTVTPDDTITVNVHLENTGDRDGDEVVQLYVKNVDSPLVQPKRQLKGFKRVHLKAGESKVVEIPLKIEDLANWDEGNNRWFVEAGEFELQVGGASDDIQLRQKILVQ